MTMRNYLRDHDCPAPTPDEELRATGKRSLIGILAGNVLALVAIVCVLIARFG